MSTDRIRTLAAEAHDLAQAHMRGQGSIGRHADAEILRVLAEIAGHCAGLCDRIDALEAKRGPGRPKVKD